MYEDQHMLNLALYRLESASENLEHAYQLLKNYKHDEDANSTKKANVSIRNVRRHLIGLLRIEERRLDGLVLEASKTLERLGRTYEEKTVEKQQIDKAVASLASMLDLEQP